jgi:hypothetical protein
LVENIQVISILLMEVMSLQDGRVVNEKIKSLFKSNQ